MQKLYGAFSFFRAESRSDHNQKGDVKAENEHFWFYPWLTPLVIIVCYSSHCHNSSFMKRNMREVAFFATAYCFCLSHSNRVPENVCKFIVEKTENNISRERFRCLIKNLKDSGQKTYPSNTMAFHNPVSQKLFLATKCLDYISVFLEG